VQPIFISHTSIVNCLGETSHALLSALSRNQSGLRHCDFGDVALDTFIGRVAGLETVSIRADLAVHDCRNNRLAQFALERNEFAQKVAAAREKYSAGRIGVFLGTSTSGIHETEIAYRRRDGVTGDLPTDFRYADTHNTYSLAAFVRRYLELRGPSMVVSSACSSTAKVFGTAARMMAAGVCDAAVVGGVDTLCLTTLYGFHALQLTSRAPCMPYDVGRDGISIGEGAGFALLERTGVSANPNGCWLLGVGESSDAYHMSTPHPDGLGARLAMKRALQSAALVPEDIDYINLHGTGTRSNDTSEDKAVVDVFGRNTPCNSTKGATGHLLGAAGVTEAIIAMLAIQHGVMPGSANTNTVDPELKCNYQITSKPLSIRRVVTNSFGFGGSNCSLVLGVGEA
jgi:3-oxoacyl-[acyl-carrier-protein] synthase-1